MSNYIQSNVNLIAYCGTFVDPKIQEVPLVDFETSLYPIAGNFRAIVVANFIDQSDYYLRLIGNWTEDDSYKFWRLYRNNYNSYHMPIRPNSLLNQSEQGLWHILTPENLNNAPQPYYEYLNCINGVATERHPFGYIVYNPLEKTCEDIRTAGDQEIVRTILYHSLSAQRLYAFRPNILRIQEAKKVPFIVPPFNQLLTDIMDKYKIGVNELARASDINPSYISRLRQHQESPKSRNPSIDMVGKISEGLEGVLESRDERLGEMESLELYLSAGYIPPQYQDNYNEFLLTYSQRRQNQLLPPTPQAQKELAGNSETLGEILRQIRKKQGYTQQELADKTGVSSAYIGSIENSKKLPSLKLALRLSEVLSIDKEMVFSCLNQEKTDYYR